MKYTKYNEDWKFWVDKNAFALDMECAGAGKNSDIAA